jgi:hypothetical protein
LLTSRYPEIPQGEGQNTAPPDSRRVRSARRLDTKTFEASPLFPFYTDIVRINYGVVVDTSHCSFTKNAAVPCTKFPGAWVGSWAVLFWYPKPSVIPVLPQRSLTPRPVVRATRGAGRFTFPKGAGAVENASWTFEMCQTGGLPANDVLDGVTPNRPGRVLMS